MGFRLDASGDVVRAVHGWSVIRFMYFLQTADFGLERFATLDAAANRAVFLMRTFANTRVSLGKNGDKEFQDLMRAIANRLY